MIQKIFAIKKGQTQIFDEKGRRMPVTILEETPCVVTQVKTKKTDNYTAIQFGIGERKLHVLSKPLQGHIKKAGLSKAPRFFREISVSEEFIKENAIKPGDVISLFDVLGNGDTVHVSGISKGKGFTGVMKRWGFKGGPATHGQSDRKRAPGSIGATSTPGRVLKGKKMAGRSGGKKVTVKNLKVVKCDKENKKVYVSGVAPGPKKGLLLLTVVKKALHQEQTKTATESKEDKDKNKKEQK